MEYAYATLLLDESNEEINETNLTAVLEASGHAVETSRVKALVAALEGVTLDDAVSDIDGEGTHSTALIDPQKDREENTPKQEDIGDQTDGDTGTSELEPDDEAITGK